MSSETVPFGKYKGRPVEDMLADADYMAWLEAQPWFREKFGKIRARRDEDAASRTPVHNRLQALFLDPAYCAAFARVAAPGRLSGIKKRSEEGMALDRAKIERWLTDQSGAWGEGRDKCAGLAAEHLKTWDAMKRGYTIAAAFEVRGCDVAIRIAYEGPTIYSTTYQRYYPMADKIGAAEFAVDQLRVEIKPTVADEYPAVLRQMARNESEYLFVGDYRGEGATEAQFVAMFAASGKRVVFKRDVDAELANDEGAAS